MYLFLPLPLSSSHAALCASVLLRARVISDALGPLGFYIGLLLVAAAAGAVLSRSVAHHPAYLEITEDKASHYRQLDGLRGILALSVFVHHCILWRGVLQGGAWADPAQTLYSQLATYAVTMFFFITGFLFWTKLMRNPRLELLPFFKSRLLRLGPVYGVAMLVLFTEVAVLSNFQLRAPLLETCKHALVWVLFCFSTQYAQPDLNGIHDTYRLIAGVTWSLRLEWCFYLTLPFLGWFAKRWYRLLLLTAFCAVVAHELYGSWTEVRAIVRSYFFFLTAGFSVGMGAAIVRSKFQKLELLRGRTASLVALGGIGFVLFLPHHSYGATESAILAVPFTLIVCGTTLWGVLTQRAMIFLGQISYSVYLLHGLVLSIVLLALPEVGRLAARHAYTWWCLCALLCGVVVSVSTVSYRFLELPFLHRRKPQLASQAAKEETPMRAAA